VLFGGAHTGEQEADGKRTKFHGEARSFPNVKLLLVN
jgi:hypothetical protein